MCLLCAKTVKTGKVLRSLRWRVTSKWVDDVDLQYQETVINVVEPEPDGQPRIPYDEANSTDVPEILGRQYIPSIVSQEVGDAYQLFIYFCCSFTPVAVLWADLYTGHHHIDSASGGWSPRSGGLDASHHSKPASHGGTHKPCTD